MTEYPMEFVMSASATTLTKKIQENGYISDIVYVVPNYTNTINTTLTIKTVEGYTLWTSGTKTQNATYRVPDPFTDASKEDIPVDYGYTATIDLSGAAGGTGGTVKVRLFIKQNKQKGE